MVQHLGAEPLFAPGARALVALPVCVGEHRALMPTLALAGLALHVLM
jgi:hypothetical protein